MTEKEWLTCEDPEVMLNHIQGKVSAEFQPHWKTQAVSQLAQAISEERDFTAMPILGDALEEAGCTNEDILSHCRNGKHHVRGCWVVDLVLGTLISIDGQLFDPSSDHFSFALYHQIGNMRELTKMRTFDNLKSASFCGSNLDDVGLSYVSDVPTIENLNLQDTKITNEGLSALEKLTGLKYLRLKENNQLSNACIVHLLKVKQLVDLQIHETSINQDGLNQLVVMDSLEDICLDVWNDNFTFDGLLRLSMLMPQCTILAKGRGEFYQGEFKGTWER